MKKILIGVLIILLVVFAYFVIFDGISLGNFSILSVEQIQTENDNLDAAIAEVQTLMYSNYASATENLETSVASLLAAKEEYLDLENVSTEAEIAEATTQETYKIEYLWTRIGSYATSEGVTLKLDVIDAGDGENKNLSFTVSGSYVAIINFVTDIEDDSELGFRIGSFKITTGSGESSREATFTVTNVRVETESTSTGSTTTVEATDVTATETDSTATTQADDTAATIVESTDTSTTGE